ncbi:hypothetical protein XENOCAPTIV_010862, partial [Xenoophorus captivus]
LPSLLPFTLESAVQKQQLTASADCSHIRTDVFSAEEEAAQQEGAMEPPEDREGRSFVEVINEKYSPENFPYRRGPGIGVVVVPTAGLQGSPMKGIMRDHICLVSSAFS